MTEAIGRLMSVIRLIVRKKRLRRVFLLSTLIYLMLYFIAIGDLSFHGWQNEIALILSPQFFEVFFKQISPFYFEAIMKINLPFMTYLFSPINFLLGALLSVLVGLNISLTYIAIVQPKACYGKPTLGVLSSLPALIAGSACCGPLVLIIFGIQVSASLIAFFGILIPIAVVLLLSTLLINGKRTQVDQLQETF